MSYIFNNKIAYSDGANVDAFSRLRVSQSTNLLDIKHTYDKNPLLVDEYVSGGTSTFDKTNARVRMSSTTIGDFIIRQSKTAPIYQPGKSQLFEASFNNFSASTGVVKRVGSFVSNTTPPFNSNLDGFFLEFNGNNTEPTFQIWKSGTSIYNVTMSAWTNTQINPYTIDWTKSQLMIVDYQWLGVGRMRFGLVLSGIPYYFAEHTSINNEDSVYMSSPNQPVRYEIRQNGVTPDYLDMICCGVSTEGPLVNGLFQTATIASENQTTLGLSGTTYPYIGLRLKEEYRTVNTNISNITIMNGTNDDFLVKTEYNPGISGTVTWSGLTNTPFEYALYNSQSLTSTTYTLASFLGKKGESEVSNINYDENQVKIGTSVDGERDELWVCIEPLGANAKYRGTVNLKYYL